MSRIGGPRFAVNTVSGGLVYGIMNMVVLNAFTARQPTSGKDDGILEVPGYYCTVMYDFPFIPIVD